MISSFLVATLRNLRRRAGFAFINVFGLGLGLACFALIMLFVRSELSYDLHNKDADRIYRIAFNGYPPSGGADEFAATGAPVGQVLRFEFPEVESVVRFYRSSPSIRVGSDTYASENVWISEPEMFDVFTLSVVDGNPEHLLEEPGTVVLSQSLATRYFGTESAVGKTVVLDDTKTAVVTAVMEDNPTASHFRADMLVSWSTYQSEEPTGWLNIGYYTYAKLAPNTDPATFTEHIKELVNERNAEQMEAIGFRAELIPERLTDIYLHSKRSGQLGEIGDIGQIWIFSAVALFVLVLAIINFTNLAIARSMDRAREVGVRKVVGSSRPTLMIQFLGESSLVALFAACIAAGLFALGLPLLNELSGKGYSVAQNVSAMDVMTVIGIAVFTGILGGLYPALVMSSYRSVDVLKGAFRSSRSGARLRKSLVAFQFAVSISLIAGTGIIVRQLDYMSSVDLGFNQERMLVVAMQNLPEESLASGAESIKDAFLERSEIIDASISGSIPGRGSGRILFGGDGIADDDIRSANVMSVGYDYFENYDIDILAGRALSEEFPSDVEQSILMSKSAVDYLGWGTPQEALGKHIDFGEGPREVVGIVANYHHASVKEAVEPMLFVMFPGSIGYLSLRLVPGDMSHARAAVAEVWTKLFPGQPIDAFFLDQDYNRQYDAEERLQRIFSVFASLAILIACLGLVGLAAFAAQQRTKEIGVRKVLGASIPGITKLLSSEFLTLVLIGFVIAVPTTWYGMNLWLETFPVQSGTGFASFIVAGMGALLVALASVSYQAIRAALADPVRALRYE